MLQAGLALSTSNHSTSGTKNTPMSPLGHSALRRICYTLQNQRLASAKGRSSLSMLALLLESRDVTRIAFEIAMQHHLTVKGWRLR
jgi:hypothetical protein